MIDPVALRSQLLGLLSSQLGTYTIDGATSVALALLPDPDLGYNYPPVGTEVSGIELVIFCPTNDYTPLMGGIGMAPATWEVRLKQWEPNGSLRDVTNALVPALANLLNYARMGQPQTIPANASRGIVQQVVIRFVEYVAV